MKKALFIILSVSLLFICIGCKEQSIKSVSKEKETATAIEKINESDIQDNNKPETQEEKGNKLLKYWLKENYGFDVDPNIYPQKKVTKRAILMVQNNYLSASKLNQTADYIDEGIENIEKYTGTTYKDEWSLSDDEKITYYLGYGVLSRCATNIDGKPIVFVSDSGGQNNALYLHESVHAVTGWKSHTTWLNEGFAVYLNGKFSRYKLWPEYGQDIYECSKSYLYESYKETLDRIGEDGYLNVDPTTGDGQAFYILSGSYVKYIFEKLGKEKFMKIYRFPYPSAVFKDTTGKTEEQWKYDWLKFLGAPNSINPLPKNK